MRYISVRFTGSQRLYTYKAEDPNIMVDDFVVVHTAGQAFPSVVKVVEVHDQDYIPDGGINYVWVVQRVDFTMFQHRTNEDTYTREVDRLEGHRRERL